MSFRAAKNSSFVYILLCSSQQMPRNAECPNKFPKREITFLLFLLFRVCHFKRNDGIYTSRAERSIIPIIGTSTLSQTCQSGLSYFGDIIRIYITAFEKLRQSVPLEVVLFNLDVIPGIVKIKKSWQYRRRFPYLLHSVSCSVLFELFIWFFYYFFLLKYPQIFYIYCGYNTTTFLSCMNIIVWN